MKQLTKIVTHSSQRGKATGWQFWPGFVLLHFDDESTYYLKECGFDSALEQARKLPGVSTIDYETKEAQAKLVRGYPPKPESAVEYFTGYGYETPISLGAWEWSCTLGRWGRTVTFANGRTTFTYPRI